jgi:microcystin-dependent protein
LTWEDHLFQTASAGTPSYSAREFRAMFAEMWDEGILEGLLITQRGAGANMSVDCNIGGAIITGDDQSRQGNYVVRCTALENKTVMAAPGSNSRLDLVVVEVLDPDSGGAAGRITQFRVIAGTPAGSPVLPALPPTAIPLAQLGPILTSTTSITTGMITDLRVWAGERVSPGTLKPHAGSRTVSGWLPCDGTVKVRATYPRLFDAIGTSYNTGGEAGTDFRLPLLTGRIPWPQGSGDVAIDTVGETGGVYQHPLTIAQMPTHSHGTATAAAGTHSHGTVTGALGDHNHNSTVRYSQVEVQAGTGAFVQQVVTSLGTTHSEATTTNGSHQHSISNDGSHQHSIVSDGGGAAHYIMPPYQVVPAYLIRT